MITYHIYLRNTYRARLVGSEITREADILADMNFNNFFVCYSQAAYVLVRRQIRKDVQRNSLTPTR